MVNTTNLHDLDPFGKVLLYVDEEFLEDEVFLVEGLLKPLDLTLDLWVSWRGFDLLPLIDPI